MPLDEWQVRLEKHFKELAASHAVTGIPLFALEHDLSKEQVGEITSLLHERLGAFGAGQPLSKHWLVWLIYATELGYGYDGEEYWHSFEEATPHWRGNVDRRYLRAWFNKFRETYNGYEPSGPWAEAFSIICWPITHAILPKYLQFQFAEALYNLRYRLVGLDRLSPTDVGRILSANAWDASTRLQAFLEREDLSGRLVLGLLTRRESDTKSPIYEPTLQRILADLERVQKTREWMKETRSVVADRFVGTARRPGFFEDHRDSSGEDGGNESPLPKNVGIQPTLMIRRSGPDLWSVMLELPDFNGIAGLDPEYRNFLRMTRSKVAGTGETWTPAGGLLYGPQKRILKSWPDPSRTVVQFERSHKIIDHLINSECRITQGPNWLCRLGPDGIAREIMGRFVRAGKHYIILTKAPIANPPDFLTPSKTDCGGICASYIAVPDKLSAENITSLHKLDLQVAQTIRIWPSGLSGRGWDGEGHSEWLTTESPCFGIVHDHPVDAYHLSIDNGPALKIEAGRVGHPMFVKIPPLPAGKYVLSAKAHRESVTRASMAKLEGYIQLRVRDPEPWIPGTTLHSGLTVLLDPTYPTLDAFWEGAVKISVLGPEGRHISVSVSLRSASGEELDNIQIAKNLDLPLSSSTWSKVFSQAVQTHDRAWSYLQAASARLSIRADELGEFIARLERDVSPVRWVCRNDQRKTEVRLIDDTGLDDSFVADYYSFAQPTTPVALASDKVKLGIEAEASGGLYVGSHGHHRDALVVGTSQASGGLAGLVTIPSLNALSGGPQSLIESVGWLQIWSEARVVGPLAGIRRLTVTKAITDGIYQSLCGWDWCRAEKAVLDNEASEDALQALGKLVGGAPASGFATVLRLENKKIEGGTSAGKRWFVDKAIRYKICTDADLCDFALKVASQPHQLNSMFGEKLEGLFNQLQPHTVLLRGARLVALLSSIREQGEAGRGMPRWQW